MSPNPPVFRRLYISSANVIIPSRDKKDSVITHGMKNIDTEGTISEVAGDEKIDKDVTASEVICVNYDISGQIMKNDRCGDECRRSKTEEHMGGIVISDTQKPLMMKNLLWTIHFLKVDTMMVLYTRTWIHGGKGIIILQTVMRVSYISLFFSISIFYIIITIII
uniref:Uncharacterized protein n=1 Tax=Oryza barthii TaxID=65489 RepID=A0A0D3F7M7_9ORYZ